MMPDKRNYPRADERVPDMGLDGVPCKDPKYWCRLHEVWLSEEDAQRKRCFAKPTFDMIGTVRCGNLERKEYKNLGGGK